MSRSAGKLAATIAGASLIALGGLAATAGARDGHEKIPRIVGGSAVSIDEFPWQVALTVSPSVSGGSAYQRQICGGTLIAQTVVVTAAHCVYDRGFQPAGHFDVVSGRTNLSSSAGQEQPVQQIYVPTNGAGNPLYDNGTTRWDVAVLALGSPAIGTPITLAGPDETSLWSAGQTAYISGWGQLGAGGGYPDGLHAAQLHMLSDSACSAEWGRTYQSDVMVCASGNGADTCPGDSGGPLVVRSADGGVRLVGSTSYGTDPCGRAASVYGRLAGDAMRGWIQQTVINVAGVDPVGSGGGGGGTPPPSGSLSQDQANQAALGLSKAACYRDRYCRRYGVRNCSIAGAGFRCTIVNLESYRYRRASCWRTLQLSGSSDSLQHRAVTRWRCVRGW